MNILLVTSEAPKYSAFSTSDKRPPLGIGFLISVLKKNGHHVYFVDNYLQPSSVLESDVRFPCKALHRLGGDLRKFNLLSKHTSHVS